MVTRIEQGLERLAPPVITSFLNKNNIIPQGLWERYGEQKPKMVALYHDVFDWHGTGRYKRNTETKEVVDILEGIVQEGGLKPQPDDWNYRAGSGLTTSTTQFRPYACFYADMFMQKHDPLSFAYGRAHDWGRYIGDKIILGSGGTFIDLLRAGNFKDRFRQWTERRIGEETSFLKAGYKLVRPGRGITSKISGNYSMLIGIKDVNHISAENLAPVYANSERRTSNVIPLEDITHIEVPEKYVAQTQQDVHLLWEKYGLNEKNIPIPEIVSREMGEVYCSEFTPRELMTEHVFRNTDHPISPQYEGPQSKKLRIALEAYHVAGLFAKLGLVSILDAIKNRTYVTTEGNGVRRRRETYAPYPFTKQDLQPDSLMRGAEYTLSQFYKWRNENPWIIREYISTCLKQVNTIKSRYNAPARISHIIPPVNRNSKLKQKRAEVLDFGVHNMSEIPHDHTIRRFSKRTLQSEKRLQKTQKHQRMIASTVEQQFPALKDSPELNEIKERLERLYAILPTKVIESGTIGKVARTILGVTAIADYDTVDSSTEERKERFRQVIYGAYVYGALYAIIDDTFQDSNNNYFPEKAKKLYHEAILEGLRTGNTIDISHLPEHPLTSEVMILYDLLRTHYPIADYPHLYHAAESMYISQNRDARLTLDNEIDYDLTNLYPDLLIKSGMSRVVANILAGRELDPNFYTRCLNSMFSDQLRDDLIDYEEDTRNRKVTAFTYPFDRANTNPLYDIFAYDAYIANVVYPGTSEILAYSEATFLSTYFSRYPENATRFLETYGAKSPRVLKRFITAASGLSQYAVRRLTPIDRKLEDIVGKQTANRNQVDMDPQTFALESMTTVNDIIRHFVEFNEHNDSGNEIYRIMRYSLEGGGKRLRPALTLMLAASLGVDAQPLTPILLASELFHTSSLLLDDLPWQDDSSMRRGRPTAHTIYDPVSVELTGVAMLLNGVGVIQELTNIYPAQDIPAITSYMSDVIQQICLGQNMDLHMTRTSLDDITQDDVLRMYHLKTSAAIEASLVPLMMLEKRPEEEINLVKQYAHHAGLVFQIKDDILDASSTAEEIGKDVQQDENKINVVRLYGLETAQQLMEYHLQEAIACCQQLPFNTNLFQGIVQYFEKRKH